MESANTNGIKTCKPEEIVKNQDVPRDAKLIGLILKAMGVEEFQPRVINQFLEFMHRYVTEVLQDAVVYSEHSNKTELDLEDVRLAILSRINYSFTQPPPRELLLELAKDKNSQPLPVIPNKLGVLLPPDQYCLTSQTYQLDAKKSANTEASSMTVVPTTAEEMNIETSNTDTNMNTTQP